MTNQNQRRDEILRLIRSRQVESQDELLGLLRQKGFDVTQPTLSRDFRDLGVVRTPAGYADPATLAQPAAPLQFVPASVREGHFESLVREWVVSAIPAGTVVVIKTPVAGAQPVAKVIDEASLPGVVGTLGGDDTIFVACSTAKAAKALATRLSSLIGAPTSRRRRA